MSKRVGVVVGSILFLLLLFILILRILVSLEAFGSLPSAEELRNIKNPLASEMYATDGQIIGKYYVENRSQLSSADLNENYIHALVATEDARFFRHGGVDYKSLMRVLFKTILLRKDRSGGGSTITQQLAKNLFPRKRHLMLSTVINKFREMSIAKRIEKVYSKEEILLLYSNTVSFGERAFGLSVASKRFYNKPPSELTLSESATLVGMLKATSYYSPRNYPDRAKRRRNVVVQQMLKYDYLQPTDTIGLMSQDVALDYTPLSKEEDFARYFKQYVSQQFRNWQDTTEVEGKEDLRLPYDGLKIYTTIDFDMQVAAERIMYDHMGKLQNIFERSWEGGRMYGKGTRVIDDKILSDPYYKSLRASGKSNAEAIEIFTKEEERQVWTWDNGLVKSKMTKIDSIKHYLRLLHTGILAADPQMGNVKAWVGGNDYGSFQYDNVTSPRQVGSLFKPIVYLAALQQGKSACDFYKNELRNYTSYQDWTPRNADEKYGGYLSMKSALTHSVNTVSVQVLFDAGIDKVVDLAKALGIKSPLNPVPSIVLGTSDVSLHDMVTAYSTLANNGYHQELSCIERIENRYGDTLYIRPTDIIEEDDAVVDSLRVSEINAMLEGVVTKGTAARLHALYNIPSAIRAKTGTTQNQSDGWFIAYTDNIVIGAWVGTDDRRMHFRNLGTGSGGRTALPMVGALLEYAYAKKKIPRQAGSDFVFECPDYLEEEDYAAYLRREERKERGNNFGGWLGDLLRGIDPKTKKTNKNRNYNDLNAQERLERIEQDREKWNKKLKRRKRKRR